MRCAASSSRCSSRSACRRSRTSPTTSAYGAGPSASLGRVSSERRPAILAVDDEPAVLGAVARDLRRGFGERYRILRASSGSEALGVLGELRARGDQAAMLIADQRMPGMSGTDYLVQARTRVPAHWMDVERDAEARELLQVVGVDEDRLPVALLEDGSVLERPTVLELAERLGVTGQPAQDHYDLVIVGGGPAGLCAGGYRAAGGPPTGVGEREAPRR